MLITFVVDSCCIVPRFVDKNCIDYKCNSTLISDTDFELASLEPGRRMDFFQLFYADTTAHIDVSKWEVLNGEKPCKIRRLEIVENNQWKKIKNRKVYGKKLLLLSFKSKVKIGDTIRIIEKDFPGDGNSLVVSIKNLKKKNSSGIYRNSSPIGQMLPKIRGSQGRFCPPDRLTCPPDRRKILMPRRRASAKGNPSEFINV